MSTVEVTLTDQTVDRYPDVEFVVDADTSRTELFTTNPHRLVASYSPAHVIKVRHVDELVIPDAVVVDGETDGEKLGRLGTDAALWARELAKVTGDVLDPSPGGILHVYLCNAIEAGRSAGMTDARTEVAEWLPLPVAFAAEVRVRRMLHGGADHAPTTTDGEAAR